MNLFNDFMKTADFLWGLATIPLILITGMFLIYFLPIPTAIGLGALIWGEQIKEQFLYDAAERCSDEEDKKDLLQQARKCAFSGWMLIIGSIGSYAFYSYLSIISNDLCKDWSGHIPGTLPAILQFFIPHVC